MAVQAILMFSVISVILRYHPNLVCMEMDARRQPIDQPTPALLINGVLAILRSQGFAWADTTVAEIAAHLLALLISSKLKLESGVCSGLYLHECFRESVFF